MKIIGLLTSLFLTFFSIGQKSYYFSDPLPSSEDKVTNVDSKYFGLYKSDEAARSYQISEEGIFIISTSISSVSREMIRESSTYRVHNNYIFGVVKDDSLPCVLEGERYYFGIQNKDVLVSTSSKSQLAKISAGRYILNHAEDGLFTPSLLYFEGNKLILEEFNYDFETTVFDKIQNQKVTPSEHFDIVILSPTKDEFNALMGNSIFSESFTFKKKRK